MHWAFLLPNVLLGRSGVALGVKARAPRQKAVKLEKESEVRLVGAGRGVGIPGAFGLRQEEN